MRQQVEWRHARGAVIRGGVGRRRPVPLMTVGPIAVAVSKSRERRLFPSFDD